jgi:hypothetical protein
VIGQIRRQPRLGTDAAYRVCSWDDELVEVEVVQAPGLERGQRFTFTRAAVTAMQPVEDAVCSAEPGV